MKFSELRSIVRQWFVQQIRIDEWSLDAPQRLITVIDGDRYPANCGVEAPVKDIFLVDSPSAIGQKILHIVLPYAVQWRFSNQLKLWELPQTALTALYTNVITEWAVNGESLTNDILSVGLTDIVESPLSITRSGDAASDWLVTAFFEFSLNCYFEAEKVPEIQPDDFGTDPIIDSFPVEIHWGLWRSKMDGLGIPAESFKDAEM